MGHLANDWVKIADIKVRMEFLAVDYSEGFHKARFDGILGLGPQGGLESIVE
jgi:hypothetical protein